MSDLQRYFIDFHNRIKLDEDDENAQLREKRAVLVKELRKHLPSPTRLREILSLAQRKNLLRFTPDPAPERAVIEVFATLKRVIPFQDFEEWNKNAGRYLASAKEPGTEGALADDSEIDKDE